MTSGRFRRGRCRPRAWSLRTLAALGTTVAALCAVAVPAQATEGASPPPPGSYTITEHQVSNIEDELCNVTSGPDGSLWFIEAAGRSLGRIDLANGAIQRFPLPSPLVVPVLDVPVPVPGAFAAGPCDMTVAGDGNLWFNDQYNNAVGYINPRPPYDMHQVKLPTPLSVPMSLATGADGDVYVTATAANMVVKVDVETHKVTEFPVPTPASGIIGGDAGEDGAHWFVEMTANKVLRFDYATHAMTEYPIPTPGALPFVVRAESDGVWFTETGANAVGHFDPATGQFDEIPLPTPASVPIGVVRGADGDLYVNESVGDKIARIDPATRQVVHEYPIPTKATFADEVKLGPDGAIWVTEMHSGKLARLWVDSFGKDRGFPQKDNG